MELILIPKMVQKIRLRKYTSTIFYSKIAQAKSVEKDLLKNVLPEFS